MKHRRLRVLERYVIIGPPAHLESSVKHFYHLRVAERRVFCIPSYSLAQLAEERRERTITCNLDIV